MLNFALIGQPEVETKQKSGIHKQKLQSTRKLSNLNKADRWK